MRPFSRVALLLTTGVFLAAADAPPATGPAAAAGGDFVARRGEVRLTADDIKDALGRADANLRDQVVANPQALSEFVKERMIRQILLTEALAAKWDQNPEVVAKANDVRDSALVQLWLASKAQVDPAYPNQAELQAAYEANKARFVVPPQYHVQQIAVLVPANATKEITDQALKKAKDLRAQAVKPGADFAELAKKNSQDANSASKGGDLGWLREDQILKPVRDVLQTLGDNAIGEPVRGSDSFHVVKLLGKKPQTTLPLEQVKPNLVAALRQARAQQMSNAYLEDMLKREPVQLNDAGLAAKFAPPK
ncbi:MAG: peptidylprolyl isomerase [Rhodospirillales bacterium]